MAPILLATEPTLSLSLSHQPNSVSHPSSRVSLSLRWSARSSAAVQGYSSGSPRPCSLQTGPTPPPARRILLLLLLLLRAGRRPPTQVRDPPPRSGDSRALPGRTEPVRMGPSRVPVLRTGVGFSEPAFTRERSARVVPGGGRRVEVFGWILSFLWLLDSSTVSEFSSFFDHVVRSRRLRCRVLSRLQPQIPA